MTEARPREELGRLVTEARNAGSAEIDRLDSRQIVELMNGEDATVASAVLGQAPRIAEAISIIADRLRAGGRLIYLGAGTSGRLGVLDATECPPTFNTRPEQVVGLIAGGPPALVRAVEGAEDRPEDGARDLDAIGMSANDVVVGIATSGRTPYVVGGLEFAREHGTFAIGFCCNDDSQLAAVADLMIVPVVGPEVISGSTRLKAGTATKMVLNMLTTGAMVLLGKTYGNLMVDLRASNRKLADRSRRIVSILTGLSESEASDLLDRAGGEVKTAAVMHAGAISCDEARAILAQHQGQLRLAQRHAEPMRHGTRTATPSPGTVAPAGPSRRSSSREGQLVLGIDGGGSKTLAWLCPLAAGDDTPLGSGEAGPSNPQTSGRDVAHRNIALAVERAFQAAERTPRPVVGLCLGLAGCGRDDERHAMLTWVREQRLAESFAVVTDAELVLDAGLPDRVGIVLIAGTGSLCLGRTQAGELIRCGGWGYLFGDEGSGYALGVAGLRAAAHSLDGREPTASELATRILKRFRAVRPEDLVSRVYPELAGNRTELADLAREVVAAARNGDAVAMRLIDHAAAELGAMVISVHRRLNGQAGDAVPLALTGGLLLETPLVRDRLREWLGKHGVQPDPVTLVDYPVLGAVRRARRLTDDAARPGQQGPASG